MSPLSLHRMGRLGLLPLCAAAPIAWSATETPRAVMPERHRALLEQHCQECHGPEKQKGKFRVDDLPLTITDLATAERWQKVLSAMNSGEMPPEEEKQPEARLKTDFLDDLSQVMVTARKSLGDQKGVIALRRLNRREYRNTLRDLLGVSVDVSELPSDTGVQGFDTVGANLFLTGNQLEQYESLGRDAIEEAFQAHESAALKKKFRLEAESIQRVALKRNRDSLDAMERVNRWIRAVDEAAARPENAAIVGELRKIAKTDDALRYHWKKIPGAPSPMEFGFDKTSEVNPAGVYLFRDRTDFIRYDEYYLGLPHLDTGSYLTVTAGYGATGAAVIQGLGIPTDFPPGEYVVRIRAAATPEAPAGRRFLEFGQKGFAGGGTPAMSVHHVTGTLEAPEVIEIPFTFTRQSAERKFRNLFIRERGAGDQGKIAQMFQEARKRNGFGPEAALWIDWIEIERAQTPPEATPPGIRALGSIPFDKEAAAPEPEKIRTALANFIKEAYRGTAAPEGLVDRLARIYDARRGVGDTHRDALKQTLASVLSSPRFLYRAEPQADAEHRALNGNELATRLSYFLWGGPPDATLRALAESGELLKPEVLTAQTERLLEHPNAAQFIRPFLTQWLALDRLDLFQFHKGLYPRFDDATKSAARQEVYETFSHLLKENGRLSDLLSADYVVINAVLADYYGIAGVSGDGFRKVALPAGSPRGGLLGMAAIMAMGSNGQRTNPVERGAWVLRKLLHEPPPPAPANVPEIARLAGQLLTTRERLRAHQEDPQCASCHRKIDPIGFGLENFDAVGQWRTTDSYQALDASGAPDPGARKTWTIEAAAQLHKGPAFRDYFGLREIIASKKGNFARAFTSALIEYALGRPCGFSDETLVEDMVRQASEKSFATREFIHALVRSKEFQSK